MQAVSDVKWSLKPGWQQHSSTGSALREEERGQQGQSNGLRETTQDTALVVADGPLSHKGHYLNGVTVSIWQISQKDWHINSFYKMNLPVYNLCGKTHLTHSRILMYITLSRWVTVALCVYIVECWYKTKAYSQIHKYTIFLSMFICEESKWITFQDMTVLNSPFMNRIK